MIHTSSLRLLVVDDYRDGADSFATLLRIYGHTARVCYSGKDALRMASDFHPDAIFLEVALPDLDGCHVATSIRESPIRRDCVLVAVSGYGRPADRFRCFQAGFDRFLVKPADPEDIKGILRCMEAKKLVA